MTAALARIDTTLGRLTAYRLVNVVLGIVAVWSLALSLTGHLAWDARDLVLTWVVLVVAGWASDRVLGWLWRTRANGESALITAQLLFFLLLPTHEVRGLALAAFTVVVANLSKFVLVVARRHAFNPAAFGAAVLFLTNWSAAGWWVATGVLLPVVALGGLAVARRTRRTAIVVAFVAVATALSVVYLARQGATGDVPALVRTVLVQYPWVFLGAFMLTEPLTSPPRRWQQWLVAGVVAVVAAFPVSRAVGTWFVGTTPEIALLAGNVVAAVLARRGIGRVRFAGSRELTPTVRELTVQAERAVRLEPGQWVELQVPHPRADARGVRRVFSVSNDARTGGELTVAFRVPGPSQQMSTYKQAALRLDPGAVLRVTSWGGDFVLPKDPAEPLLLAAGGIGITPFAAQLAAVTGAGEAHRDVVVVWSVPRLDELAYADVVAASGARVVVVVTGEGPGDAEAGPGGRGLPAGWTVVRGSLDREVLADAVPDAAARTALVSGPPAMVDDVRATLRGLGVRRVRTDAFSGY